MQSAEAVVEVLRARGRRGLPCERLYRQLFNTELFLMAFFRTYFCPFYVFSYELDGGGWRVSIHGVVPCATRRRWRVFEPLVRVEHACGLCLRSLAWLM